MIKAHNTHAPINECTLTERGQISIPAALRKRMGLHTGQRLEFERISDREFRVLVKDNAPAGPLTMLGYARKLRPEPARRTREWMKELREGEKLP